MKIFYSVVLFLFFLNTLTFAQADFSANTQLLESIVKKRSETILPNDKLWFSEKEIDYFVIKEKEGVPVTGAIIKVNEEIDETSLYSLGVKINSRIGNIWTISVPLQVLPELREIQGLVFVDTDRQIRKKLDNTRVDTKTDLVHSGTLPQIYKGNGVIIGIIDGGFDFTHPTFRDSENNLRIVRVWEQNEDSGTPPIGFTYGSELTNSTDILEAEASADAGGDSHGSHVAGIAGGSGVLTNGVYTGIAPESDLVFVTMRSNTGIVDGVNYIFNYAQSVSKPAVVNMSLGEHIGPHDGTSLVDQAFDQLAGPGKILVGSAGNEATNKIHLYLQLNNSIVKTNAEFEGSNPLLGEGVIDSWGESGSNYEISVNLFNSGSGIDWTTPFVASSNSGVFSYSYINNADTLGKVEFSVLHNAPHNQKSNILIKLSNEVEAAAILTIKGTGNVHLWNNGQGSGADFSNLGGQPGFVEGDTLFSVGEIGGTSKSIITVGAYTTKNTYTNSSGNVQTIPFYNEVGMIAPFSSVGPTADLRLKPEITAPGNVIISAYCSFDTTIIENNKVLNITSGNGSWWFGSMQGTSMSCPVITGSVALMLEANNTLSYQNIVDIFKSTAREDQFTGSIPENGSTTWGYGKIDVLQSVATAVNSINDVETTPGGFVLHQNYPNPFNPITTIKFSIPVGVDKLRRTSLKVYDVLGNEVAVLLNEPKAAGTYEIKFDAGVLSSGIYFYRLISDNFISVKKLVVIK